METILNQLSQSLTENPFLAYFGVFLGGILSSSSPCVLATIPLVIGYVGGYSEGDRRKAFLYSLTFILGLSITFTILGAIASLVGGLFGIVSSPCATPVLALILTFVASKGEVAYGTSLLFVYALGHCALIFLAGTATGFVENFVKSKGISNVTIWGKRLGGLIVVLVGIYLFYLGITL